MLRIITIGILSLSLFACAGNPPKMERPVQVWNGAPEIGGICRISKEVLAMKIRANAGHNLTAEFAQEIADVILSAGQECIDAKDERMKQMGCMTWDDHAVIQRYIENLNFKCEKWKE